MEDRTAEDRERERAELFKQILEERNELLREKMERRTLVSWLFGDKGHRTEGFVTVAFVLFLVGGFIYYAFFAG
ncbi:hypothetical protein ACGFIF_43685 [Kribbella sp. NPDC049174]|uniref:hypothetical protein n=1 Tax=Kribbella sp. NPDC049174 TaxID=3364112 RepID=UPI003720BE39